MENTNFKLILLESTGVYAIPDIEISSEFETSFSIQDAADISQRKDSISKNITFPGTKNNNRIFNNLYSLNRNSEFNLVDTLFANYSPNVGVRAVLYENNYPIMTGDLKINDIARNKETGTFTYSGIITGQTVSFFSKIKDLLLTDIQAFDSVKTYTWPNIKATWFFTDADDFLYPMIDYGNGVRPHKEMFDVRGCRPAIYLTKYVEAILESQGYTLSSISMFKNRFKKAFIPFSEQSFGKTIFGNFATANTATTSAYNPGGLSLVAIYGAFTVQPYITINRAKTFSSSAGGAPQNTVGDSFTVNRVSQTAMTFSMSVTVVTDIPPNIEMGLCKVNPDGTIRRSEIIGLTRFEDVAPGQVCKADVTMPFGTYNIGDEFLMVAYVITIRNFTVNQTASSAVFGNPDAAVGSTFDIELGETFNLKDAVPKGQKAADFLKSIFQFYNMYAIENPENPRELIIEEYDLFYDKARFPAGQSYNWTDKIDNSTLHLKINTQMPKAYNFKFKEDSDYYNTLYKNTYGSVYGNYTVTNRIGSVDPKNIDVSFSPTVIVKEAGEDKTFPAIFTGDILNKKPMKSNLRILFNNGSKPCDPYDVVLTNGEDFIVKVSNEETYQASHHTLDIDANFSLIFGIPEAVYYEVTSSIFDILTVYSELYKKQLAELNDNNIFTLECDADLNERDVSGLDLRTPVFISTDQGNAYFKIMSIAYYNRDEISKVVLQKIIL